MSNLSYRYKGSPKTALGTIKSALLLCLVHEKISVWEEVCAWSRSPVATDYDYMQLRRLHQILLGGEGSLNYRLSGVTE